MKTKKKTVKKKATKVKKKKAKLLKSKRTDSTGRPYNYDYDEPFNFEVNFNGHTMKFYI